MDSLGRDFEFFPLVPPWNNENKSCLNELKFWEASKNHKSSICWKFQLSISCGTQKSAKIPLPVAKKIWSFWCWYCMFKVSSTPTTAIALCPDWLAGGCVLSYIMVEIKSEGEFWIFVFFHDYFYKEIINFKNQLPLLCQFVKINPVLNGL